MHKIGLGTHTHTHTYIYIYIYIAKKEDCYLKHMHCEGAVHLQHDK
jgi:hypothetical protein